MLSTSLSSLEQDHYLQEPSWDFNSRLASQAISCILQNSLKVHYLIHNRPPADHILDQVYPPRNLISYTVKIPS